MPCSAVACRLDTIARNRPKTATLKKFVLHPRVIPGCPCLSKKEEWDRIYRINRIVESRLERIAGSPSGGSLRHSQLRF